MAKKISFLLISLELIDASLIFNFEEMWLELFVSFRMFNLKLSESDLFLILMLFNISSLSENNFFLFLYSCVFSCPLPATINTSPVFKLTTAFLIAFALFEIS